MRGESTRSDSVVIAERLRIVSLKSARRHRALRQMGKTLKVCQQVMHLQSFEIMKLRQDYYDLHKRLAKTQEKVPFWRTIP